MKHIIIILFLIAFGTLSVAQDYAKWQAAFEKSYALEKKQDFKGALDVLESCYTENSYDCNIRYGWLYYNLGDFPRSKSYYKKAMEILPYSLEAKFGYVLPLAGLGEWDEIISIYKSILKLDPKNTIVNYRLGAIYYERKDYQAAYNYLEEVINLYPNDFDSNLLFAWTNLQMGKLKEAKVLFNKALLISPQNESAKEGLKLIK